MTEPQAPAPSDEVPCRYEPNRSGLHVAYAQGASDAIEACAARIAELEAERDIAVSNGQDALRAWNQAMERHGIAEEQVVELEAERDTLKADNERLRGELADVEIGVCDKKRWRCLVCRLQVQPSESHYHAVKQWAAVPKLVN